MPLCETVQKGGLGRLGVAEVKGTIVGSGSGVPADGACRLCRDNLECVSGTKRGFRDKLVAMATDHRLGIMSRVADAKNSAT